MIEMHVTLTHTITDCKPTSMILEYSRIPNLNEARAKIRNLVPRLKDNLAYDQRLQVEAKILRVDGVWITIYKDGMEYEVV